MISITAVRWRTAPGWVMHVSLVLGGLSIAVFAATTNLVSGYLITYRMLGMFKLLAKMKGLRGTAFDPFGYSTERKTERALVRDYEALLDEVLGKLDAGNHHIAVGLAAIPEKIRGFGHVKLRHLKAAKADEAVLLDQFRAGPAPLLKAAE